MYNFLSKFIKKIYSKNKSVQEQENTITAFIIASKEQTNSAKRPIEVQKTKSEKESECEANDNSEEKSKIHQNMDELIHYQPVDGELNIPIDHAQQAALFDIPISYTPNIKGYPANISGTQILCITQAEIMDKICKASPIGEKFKEYIVPLIVNVAEFVHLLPASEHHHHRSQGGLLRHNLEVCLNAIQMMGLVVYDETENSEQKSFMALRWRIAVIVGALLHDIGKPLTDYEIWDKSGKYRWIPSSNTIFEWALEHGIERYVLVWNAKRHNSHRLLASSMIQRIVPENIMTLLQENTGNLYLKVLDAITTVDPTDKQKQHNALIDIIIKSDKKSVIEDLKKSSGDAIRSSGTGVGTVQRIVDTIRYFISIKEWTPNAVGSPIWVTNDGIYIVWRAASERIYKHIKELDVFIPKSADSMADILASNNLIEETPQGSVYWKVATQKYLASQNQAHLLITEPTKFCYCLKLISSDTIFKDTFTPLPITAFVCKHDKWFKYEVEQITEDNNDEKTEISAVQVNTDLNTPRDAPPKTVKDSLNVETQIEPTFVVPSYNEDEIDENTLQDWLESVSYVDVAGNEAFEKSGSKTKDSPTQREDMFVTSDATSRNDVLPRKDTKYISEAETASNSEMSPSSTELRQSVNISQSMDIQQESNRPLASNTKTINLEPTARPPLTKKPSFNINLNNNATTSPRMAKTSLITPTMGNPRTGESNSERRQLAKQKPKVSDKKSAQASTDTTAHNAPNDGTVKNISRDSHFLLDHTELFLQTHINQREHFENFIMGLSIQQLLEVINQNHLLYSMSLPVVPESWIMCGKNDFNKRNKFIFLRSAKYLILRKELLTDICKIKQSKVIYDLLTPHLTEKSINIPELTNLIRQIGNAEQHKSKGITLYALNNKNIQTIADVFSTTDAVIKKLIAIHFESITNTKVLTVRISHE